MVNRTAYPQQSFFQCVLPRHCFQKVTVVFHLHLCALNEEHADVLQDKRDRPSLPDAAGEEGHGGLDAPHHSFCRHKGGRSYLSIPQGFQKFVTWKTTQEGWGWGSNTGYTRNPAAPRLSGMPCSRGHGVELCLEPAAEQVPGSCFPLGSFFRAAGSCSCGTQGARCESCSTASSLCLRSISNSPTWERDGSHLVTLAMRWGNVHLPELPGL